MMPTELPLASDLLVKQINEQILQAYLEINERGEFIAPPKDDDELHEFIRLALKVRVPRKVIEPGHKAPFEFLADMFFERVSNALVFANRHGGKALALNTSILTTQGWLTMGQLCVGDVVFAPDGTPTRIYTTSVVYKDHPCFKVLFNSGQEIISDAEHLWVVTHAKETQKQLLSTRDIYDRIRNPPSIGYKTLYFIDRAKLLCLPEQTLAVPPYVLGAWLGDGAHMSRHGIKRIVPIPSVPVRCIGVEHPSNLFLAGRDLIPTHNTWNLAILNLLDLLFKPGCEIGSAGSTKDQAKNCYVYMQEFMEADWFIGFCHQYLRKTGRTFVKKEIQEETAFQNRSKLKILTATQKGVRGPHPHKARLDEIDEMEWEIIQTGLSMASSSRGIKGQNCFSSTRQYERGSMQRLLETAAEKGISIYEWNVWETVEKCRRRCFDDPEHGDCSVYTFCKGKAHRCDGFIEVGDFIDKLRLLDRDRFETEWLNEKPSRSKLVYGQSFVESRHIMTPEKLKALTGIPFVVVDWRRVCGIDFGGGPGHPFVYLKLCQLHNGAWLLFFEYIAEQRLMRDHAKVIKGSPWWHKNEWNFSDHARQDRMELKHKGVSTRPANKAVTMGIDYIEELFCGYPPSEEPMLYIWYQCTYTIMEFGLYSWQVGHDGKVLKDGPPAKKHDDTMDALRYALYSLKERPKRRYRTRRSDVL